VKATKYTKEELEKAIKGSTSMRQAMIKLGIKCYGGNYKTIKRYIKEFNLDTSHFLGKGSNKGRKFTQRIKPIESYLVLSEKSTISSSDLKRRLINENIFEHKCYQCDNTEWNGELVPIDLHHIDGNHHNNELENLIILCPNCHRQRHNENKRHKCECGKIINHDCKRCKKCHLEFYKDQISHKNRRVKERSRLNTLYKDVEELGYCGTGRKYGVSDNTIRKWIRTYETL